MCAFPKAFTLTSIDFASLASYKISQTNFHLYSNTKTVWVTIWSGVVWSKFVIYKYCIRNWIKLALLIFFTGTFWITGGTESFSNYINKWHVFWWSQSSSNHDLKPNFHPMKSIFYWIYNNGIMLPHELDFS